MKQRLFTVLLLGSLLVWNAMGQNPPPTPAAKPKDPISPPLTVEEIIQRAAKNDPEVKIAESELQLAKAKLDAVRINAVKKIAEIHNKLEEAIGELKSTEKRIFAVQERLTILKDQAEKLHKSKIMGGVSTVEVSTAQAAVLSMQEHSFTLEKERTLAGVKAARLQNEWKRMVDLTTAAKVSENRVELDTEESVKLNQRLEAARKSYDVLQHKAKLQFVTGSPAEKLKTGLAKKVKLEAQETDLESLTKILLAKADLDVIISYDLLGEDYTAAIKQKLKVPAGEVTLFGWLEYIADKFADSGQDRTCNYYIREYGIAMMAKENTPATAIKLQDFWRQIQEEKAQATTPPEKK